MEMAQEQLYWEAVQKRDASLDGTFVYAVISSGVFCRPGCPSRRPRRERIQFFSSPLLARDAGFRPCLRCKPLDAKPAVIETVCRYIEQHLDVTLSLDEIAASVNLSPFHLQRKFKAALGITPREYANACRMRAFKGQVKSGHSVTEAIYEAGFGSSSRLYERAASELGMRPRAYRQGGACTSIRYTTDTSPIGPMLIAATEKGICSIQFADSEDELEAQLRSEFPNAQIVRDEIFLAAYAAEIQARLQGQGIAFDLPLDIRATAFQRVVWNFLQTIPPGQTMSYSAVAEAIGKPAATRAVAGACAANRVAVAIPCHRVVPVSGKGGGYRWGPKRKQELLTLEKERANLPATETIR
jgi:AraC family transcriptional regulator of adaptative response/methylated-DNA-[protein]-cysteine methyltransferase